MLDLFPTAVYLLCFATSSACAYLLARSYARTGTRLLLWSALCFLFLAANNLAVVTMGFVVAGLFFLRFWKRTGDSLFLAFALAFWLLGLTQALLALADVLIEERSWLYLIRLAAFSLILLSIWLKNRRA